MNDTPFPPATRTVRDAAISMDAVAGYHPIDPDSVPRRIFLAKRILIDCRDCASHFIHDLGSSRSSATFRAKSKRRGQVSSLGHEVTSLTKRCARSAGWIELAVRRGYAMRTVYRGASRDFRSRVF